MSLLDKAQEYASSKIGRLANGWVWSLLALAYIAGYRAVQRNQKKKGPIGRKT